MEDLKKGILDHRAWGKLKRVPEGPARIDSGISPPRPLCPHDRPCGSALAPRIKMRRGEGYRGSLVELQLIELGPTPSESRKRSEEKGTRDLSSGSAEGRSDRRRSSFSTEKNSFENGSSFLLVQDPQK